MIRLADNTKADTLQVGQILRVKANTFGFHFIPLNTVVTFEGESLAGEDYAFVVNYSRFPPLKQTVPFVDLEVV